MAEDEIAELQRPVNEQGRQVVRYLSRRGSMPIVTFVNFDNVPDILRQTEAPKPIQKYGCKYFDPESQKPFNDISEFKRHRKQIGIPWNYERLNV
jgi:hypothetical protein